MQQGDDYYDDDYYDDDDDYYDEESGPSPLVLALVGVVLLMGLGAAGLAGYIFVQKSSRSVDENLPEVSANSGDEGAGEETSGPADVDLDGETEVEETEPDEEERYRQDDSKPSYDNLRASERESWTPSPRRTRGSSASTRGDTGSTETRDRDRRDSRRDSRTTSRTDRSAERRRTSGSSSGSSSRSSASSGSSRRGQEADTTESSSAQGSSFVIEREPDSSDEGPGNSAPPEEGPQPGETIGDEPSLASSEPRGYDKDEIVALGTDANRGTLDRDDVDYLKKVPGSSKNFTLAWSTVLKDADTKRNYRDHCNAAQRLMSLPENKYHPEWNLEMAKCHLRNSQWSAAVRSVDRTLTDTYGMAAATKSKRILLAHEIRAISKTQIFEKNSESNSGLTDDVKLRSAIQAWTDYKNFARGTGDTSAQQQADKELADLEGKMN